MNEEKNPSGDVSLNEAPTPRADSNEPKGQNVTQGQPAAATSPSTKVGALVLSGGGFRASLFHMGVLFELLAQGKLPLIQSVTGISGGAIVASFTALHWSDLVALTPNSAVTGAADQRRILEEKFRNIMAPLFRLIDSDLRGRVFRQYLAIRIVLLPILIPYWLLRWIPPVRWIAHTIWRGLGKLGAPEADLDAIFIHNYNSSLYNNCADSKKVLPATLQQLPQNTPKVYLCATDYGSGNLCWACDSGIYEMVLRSDGNRQHTGVLSLGGDTTTLGQAVYGSSAFPPVLPPTRVSLGRATREYLLGDGGMWDNLGARSFDFIRKNCTLTKPGQALTIFLSNAELALKLRSKASWWIWPRGLRVPEILMNRLTQETLIYPPGRSALEDGTELYHIPLDPQYYYTLGFSKSDGWEAVAELRTDLDVFSDLEQRRLFSCGQALAQWTFQPKGGPVPDAVTKIPSNETALLREGGARKLRLLVWDRAVICVVCCLLLYAVAVAGLLYWRHARQPDSVTLFDATNLLASRPLGYRIYAKSDGSASDGDAGDAANLIDQKLESGVKAELPLASEEQFRDNMVGSPRLTIEAKPLKGIEVATIRVIVQVPPDGAQEDIYLSFTWQFGSSDNDWSRPPRRLEEYREVKPGCRVYEFHFPEPKPIQGLLIYLGVLGVGARKVILSVVEVMAIGPALPR